MSPASEKTGDDVFEDEKKPTYTIDEYLQGIEDRELEAEMVLGGDYGDMCTYEKGYMKRQALFSCLTCTPEGNAWDLTACTLSCHEGHEILELWTKRNFRCDCGNSKFGNFICKLQASKDLENVDNSYNHNFKGTYCTCDRPYPDPDVEDEEEMVQCCICEDWFHREHLGLESSETIPIDEEGQALYEDLICQGCSAACSFLTLYPQSIFVAPKKLDVETNDEKGKGKEMVDEASSGCASPGKNEVASSDPPEPYGIAANILSGNIPSTEVLVSSEISRKDLSLKNCSHDSSSGTACQLGIDLGDATRVLNNNKTMFLNKDWRYLLCRCDKCSNFYKQKSVSFLLDKDDSIAEYEDQAKKRREERLQQQEQNSVNMFNNLGHVEKVEIMSGIADMQSEIGNFLASRDNSEAVTPADVYQLFENLKNKRRRQI
ncbi:LOW QUALITY PROTEIN: uncharacterized protein LOC141653655 [Silene latifolia]|uniref:LOW QUALITY PROTEIN: uncharacterized protein LOC141653655 n=1 Tax=Silene latifolia TaxID=37657 RepID=UPI003D77F5F7